MRSAAIWSAGAPVSSSFWTSSDCSTRFGRNSCSGGSSRRTVTGRPFIAVKISSKSACCIGRIFARAATRSSSFSARIISRTAGRRSATMNMCSVRARPMPSAPSSRAFEASSKFSALARTPSVRTSSAHLPTVSKSSFSATGTSGSAPAKTSPVEPLRVTVSFLPYVTSPIVTVSPLGSILMPVAPATQVMPMPRATTAAWLVMPPWAVSTPWETMTPWMSSGVVSKRTRMTFSPLPPRSAASSAENERAPTAAPGEAGRPFTMTGATCSGSMPGWSSASSCVGSMRSSASSLVMRPSSTMSTAVFTAAAAVKTAVDMVEEGLITKEEALLRIEPSQLDALLHPGIDPEHVAPVIVKGLPASPGAAVGALSFSADDAAERGGKGEKVILVRFETNPDDIHGVMVSQGVLTAHGGMTSHAAVVARGMGITCVAGATGIKIDPKGETVTIGEVTYGKNDTVTLNGSTGEVFAGALPLVPVALNEDFETVGKWADEVRTLGVRANAENFEDASKARELGAEGIGLARTEHMFMVADRLPAVREMILAENEEERVAALAKILPMQQADFEEIFTAMKGLPVTVRLLDPPLHEFLTNLVEQSLLVQKLELTGAPADQIAAERITLAQVNRLHEQNPMLGTRGCRLAMLYPSIPDMQARAIIKAALAVLEKEGETVGVEIMIPLVSFESELRIQREIVTKAVEDEFAKAGKSLPYTIGTMIEIPRAALIADQIANEADFFSFGTNDLTQTGIGISRDDAELGFLGAYVDNEVIEKNPFESLDQEGVGQLVAMGVEKGRQTKPGLKTGVCGEHGGDPDSIDFFHRAGLSYVSCSPFRVPIARLAAARAALKNK